MYLKRIEARGFKSFAEKIDVDFGRGITAIVGPNGSGKSNISDAIRWVLGEQSAKTLRGGKMEDVIFAGTENRKSLGCAEVSLTIDNGSGMLPFEYSEITVTRRLYRSGESEYLINNSICRLKDIVELFMDTGIGKDGYSLIGQGKIDEILSTRSEDRRNIFEEAAGIVKFKSRKLEAEKKLDSTKQNLIRITDIINELQEQIEPLLEQSKVAREYLNFKEELKSLEISLILNNFETSKKKLDKINEDIRALYDNKNLYEDKKINITSEIEGFKAKLKHLENELELRNNEKFEKEKNHENKLGGLRLLDERKENYSNEKDRLDSEIKELEEQIVELDKEEELFRGEKQEKVFELEEKKEKLEGVNSQFAEVNNNSRVFEESVQNKKSEAIQFLKEVSDLNNKISTSKVMMENLTNRKSQLDREKNNKNELLSNLQAEISKCENTLAEDNIKMNELKLSHEKILSKLAALEMESKGHVLERNKCFDRLKTQEARHNSLSELEKDMEGFNRAVKSILSSYKGDNRVYGVVSDLITVPKGYETAIEIALGPAVQNIVIDNEQTAGMLINFLKKNNHGRATFLPLSTIKARSLSLKGEVTASNGYLGVASELISFDPRFFNILSSLLGRVLICDTLDNASKIAKLTDHSYRIVTLEGDVINTGGSYTGGSINSKGSGIFSRKNEISELKEKIEIEKKLLEKTEEKLEKNAFEANIYRSTQSTITLDIQNITVKLQTEENRIKVLNGQLNSYGEDINDINTELKHIANQCVENEEFVKSKISDLDKINSLHNEAENEINTLQEELKKYQVDKEKLWEQITSEKISIAEINKSIEAIDNKIIKLQGERNSYRTKIEQHQRALEENSIKIEEIHKEIIVNKENLAIIESEIEKVKNEIAIVDENIKSLSEDMEAREKSLKAMEEEINSVVLSIHKYEMSTSKLEAETEMLTTKLWDEYELSIAGAVKYRIQLNNISEANKRLNQLKTNIKELGDVNVNSIEEYKRVTERHSFLLEQKNDLCNAEETLVQIINEITKKMEIQFVESFKIIREHFNFTFKELFGGGYADLKLEGDDVLNTGIEIIVQPPGKKLQSLSLLSGGERGLAAIALVFAILKMKPTPFCVLDEIEAALDDANVNRFAGFLREYSKNTQFIMITHRKGSMAVADALYGVTMEEKGVSKMLSLRLKEEKLA